MQQLIKIFLITISISLTGMNGQCGVEEKALIPKTQVGKYHLDTTNAYKLYLEMPFAKDEFVRPVLVDSFKFDGIISIDLVFTKYREVDEFSQLELNKRRYVKLARKIPSIASNPLITWRNVEQVKGETKEEARKLFHGFVITYRPIPTSDYNDEEVQFILNNFGDKVNLSEFEFKSNPPPKKRPVHRPSSNWDKIVGYNKSNRPRMTAANPKPKTIIDDMEYDSTVTKNLDEKDWKKMLVVIDVTGSMSPYTAQVFEWLSNNIDKGKIKHFVFFNDGDTKKTRAKKIGRTGGLYDVPATSLEEVIKTALRAMKGSAKYNKDNPENDFEGIIKGSRKCTDCETIVLIADNNSFVRDYPLLPNIKKPIRIIGCGVYGRVNIQYLDLARSTGGSFHYSGGDVYNLDKVNEGESVKIGDYTYFIQNGMFQSN